MGVRCRGLKKGKLNWEVGREFGEKGVRMSDFGGEGRDALKREEMGIELILFSPVSPFF